MTNQTRSRRILIVIGIGALVLLALPLALRPWAANQAIAGKVLALEVSTARDPAALELCLLRRGPGGLGLEVASQDTFTNHARQLTLRVVVQGKARKLQAWLPRANSLTPGESAAIARCLGAG